MRPGRYEGIRPAMTMRDADLANSIIASPMYDDCGTGGDLFFCQIHLENSPVPGGRLSFPDMVELPSDNTGSDGRVLHEMTLWESGELRCVQRRLSGGFV